MRGATCAEQLAQCNLRRATCADQLAPTSLRRAPCLVLSRACFTNASWREKERILQRWADLACDVMLSGQPWSSFKFCCCGSKYRQRQELIASCQESCFDCYSKKSSCNFAHLWTGTGSHSSLTFFGMEPKEIPLYSIFMTLEIIGGYNVTRHQKVWDQASHPCIRESSANPMHASKSRPSLFFRKWRGLLALKVCGLPTLLLPLERGVPGRRPGIIVFFRLGGYINGLHWFRWVLFHSPGSSIFPKGHMTAVLLRKWLVKVLGKSGLGLGLHWFPFELTPRWHPRKSTPPYVPFWVSKRHLFGPC